MVERVMPTVRYVSVEGPVTRTIPGTDELLWEIAARYLPLDKVPAYIEFVGAELGEQVAIYLRPERWLTADLRPGAVPPQAHRRDHGLLDQRHPVPGRILDLRAVLQMQHALLDLAQFAAVQPWPSGAGP